MASQRICGQWGIVLSGHFPMKKRSISYPGGTIPFASPAEQRVICMAEGAVLAEGTAEEVKNNEEVIEAYLGRGLKNKDMKGSQGAPV